MTARRLFVLLSLFTLILGLAATGRSEKPKADKPLPLPEVEVVHPVIREVVDYVDFHGEVEPYPTIRLKSRATGQLERIHVKEGAKVKKGDLLFEIDARSAMAERKKAEAALAVAQAALAQAEVELKRTRLLLARKATSQEDVDRADAARKTALAQVHLAEANLDIARLNLEHTRILAPRSGRIGRGLLVVGSLVKADETELASLDIVDPVRLVLNIGEPAAHQLRSLGNKNIEVALSREYGDGYPHKMVINEIAYSLDPENDNTLARTTLTNSDGRFKPKMSIGFRRQVGKPYRALLIPWDAYSQLKNIIPRDEHSNLLVLNNKDELEERKVSYGQYHGELSIVTKGLTTTDRVVVAVPDKVVVGYENGVPVVETGIGRLPFGRRVKPRLISIPETKK